MGFGSKLKDFTFGKDYGKKDKKTLDNIWGPAQGQIASLYGGAYANQTKALNEVRQGFEGAGTAINKGGAAAARSISEQYAQGAAADRQSLASRGLGSTGALDAVRRGARSDRARSLADLDARISQMHAELQANRGQAMAGAYGNLAGTQLGFQGLLAQMAAGRGGQYGQIQYGRQGGFLAGVAPLAGAALGGAFGGPMGAAAGSQMGGGLGGASHWGGGKKQLGA